MARESNGGFHQHQPQSQGSTILFIPNTSSRSLGYELIPVLSNPHSGAMNLGAVDGASTGIQIFPPSTSVQNNSFSSPSALYFDPGLKHDTGFSVEWSVDEQFKLEEGLAKYANEPNILRYIKIASSLHDKTVRDVALRCKWMMRKRRKPDDHSSGMIVKDNFEPKLKNDMPTILSINGSAYSMTTKCHKQTDHMLSGALSSTARHLLEENNQIFGQISSNLSSLKLQENIDLFCRTRNNITTVLKDMRNMSGIMGRMPPLPVVLNEELMSSIFPPSQPMMFGSSGVMAVKREPGCC